MKTLLVIALCISVLGCSQQRDFPAVQIEIDKAYASDPNSHLKGSVTFSGLELVKIPKGNFGIRMSFFYASDKEIPKFDVSHSIWQKIPPNSDKHITPIDLKFGEPVNVDDKKFLVVLASIQDGFTGVELMKIWNRVEINWIDQFQPEA